MKFSVAPQSSSATTLALFDRECTYVRRVMDFQFEIYTFTISLHLTRADLIKHLENSALHRCPWCRLQFGLSLSGRVSKKAMACMRLGSGWECGVVQRNIWLIHDVGVLDTLGCLLGIAFVRKVTYLAAIEARSLGPLRWFWPSCLGCVASGLVASRGTGVHERSMGTRVLFIQWGIGGVVLGASAAAVGFLGFRAGRRVGRGATGLGSVGMHCYCSGHHSLGWLR
jgi:hypothetical protein